MASPAGRPAIVGEARGRRLLGLFALFVLVSLLTRWLSLVVEVLDVDEAAHAVGSWVLLDGGRLYTDFVDNKPPLLYVYYALAQLLLGRGLFPVHVFTAVVSVPLTALAASAAFRHDRRGVAAALLWLVYGTSFLAHDMLAAHAELVLLLPASWAIAFAADERRAARWLPLLLAGLLLGLATLVKHQAAFWLPALGWAALGTRRAPGDAGKAARVVALGAGFALPLLATWVVFAATGDAHDLVYWLVWRNVLYAANPITAAGALERAARYLLPWLVATAPLWWAWKGARPGLDGHHRRMVDGLVVLGLAPALAGFRFFPHYFIPTVFALALGAGPAVARWWERPRERAGRVFLASTLVLALGFTGANAWLYLGDSGVYREQDPVYRAVAERLAADECFPGSRLFVWGWAPAFYYEAGLRGGRPASRFAVLAAAGLTGYVPGNPDGARRREPGDPVPAPAHWDWLMGDLERTSATYILDTAPAGLYRWNRYPLRDYPRLDRYVAEGYDRIDEVSRVHVYRRHGCVARGQAGSTLADPVSGRRNPRHNPADSRPPGRRRARGRGRFRFRSHSRCRPRRPPPAAGA
jgi:hypothetical protein